MEAEIENELGKFHKDCVLFVRDNSPLLNTACIPDNIFAKYTSVLGRDGGCY